MKSIPTGFGQGSPPAIQDEKDEKEKAEKPEKK